MADLSRLQTHSGPRARENGARQRHALGLRGETLARLAGKLRKCLADELSRPEQEKHPGVLPVWHRELATAIVAAMVMKMKACQAAAALLLLHSALPARAGVLFGKVVGVADGDTVTLVTDSRQIRVRIAGIDAPERKQDFGQRAKRGLSDCAFGKDAELETSKTDRYGRVVGKITVGGVDCGLRQVQLGLAWHYKAYEKEQSMSDRASYSEAEIQSRASRRGLWSYPSPQAPWEFRRENRTRR